MSMSLGTTSDSDGTDSQSQLVNQANAAGIAVIIAMGNDGDEEVPHQLQQIGALPLALWIIVKSYLEIVI